MADYLSQFTGSEIDARLAKVPQLETGKQDKLVSGSNIKTVNGQSILGSGNIEVQAGDTDAVKYVAQTLTEEQKAQARANIDAASLADIADMDFVTAASLPTASASTMGHIYLIGPDSNNNYDRYFTQEEGSSYSWVSLGSTQIDLSTYATKSEVSQLEAEVHNLSGKYYGVHASSATLPDDADAPGYAFVGSANPYAIWNFDGATWSDSGSVANGISGEPGVGLDDVTTPTPADGTVVMHLSNGNTVTLNLNHNHPQYAKVVMCEDLTEYNAISPKDNMTIYLIPQVAMYLGSTLMLEQNSAPLPYTPVDYIETDGDAYIDTGIIGAPVKSAEMKVLPAGGASYTILGSRGSTNDGEAKKFQMFRIIYYSADSIYVVGYGYYYSVAGASNPSVTDSVTNETPFIVKGSFKNGAQRVSVKEEGESSFRSNSTTYTKTITSSLNMYIFAANENGTAGNKATSGTRVYYCKIYSDDSYSTLLFNGVPCYYNNEYGLWDKVSNTFFGAVSGSGTITGPSIS